MKFILSALFVLSSLSAFAGDLRWEVEDKNCHVEVLEDVYILHSTQDVILDKVRLTALSINRNENRRLRAGRIIPVRTVTDDKIIFRDGTMRDICVFASNNGMCLWTRNLDVSDIATYSQGMLQMVCVPKGTVDA